MIPIYNLDILPAITHPFESKKIVTKRYLGGKAITGQEYATLNIFSEDNAKTKALYDFWKDDCNYGTVPFLIALPMFGITYDKAYPSLMVQFYEDITAKKIEKHWTQDIKIKVLGTVDYITDDSLNYIIDDTGNYIVTDAVSNSNKEITHG